MNNQQVINAFKQGRKGTSSNGNLRSTGDKLINYYTTIAQRLTNGKVIMNSTKYSVSTSKIQSWTRRTLDTYTEVTDVPRGTSDLQRYV